MNTSNLNTQRIIAGLKESFHKPYKFLFPTLYTIVSFYFFFKEKETIFSYFNTLPFYAYLEIAITLFFYLLYFMGLLGIITFIGFPLSSFKIEQNFKRSKLVNAVGETPIVLRKYKDRKTNNTIFILLHNGITIESLDNKVGELSLALKSSIVSMEYGEKMDTIIVEAKPYRKLPKMIRWKNEYLPEKDYILALGESQTGIEFVNLNIYSHLLFGGTTNSGKTGLLKLVAIQALMKGHTVIIADFKYGLNFNTLWKKHCSFITTREELNDTLSELIRIMHSRMELLKQTECEDIIAYNQKNNTPMKRIILACDELTEGLSLTDGNTKEDEKIVKGIQEKLSTLARLSRATGIQLVLSLQRPSADILNGQIRSNMNYKACTICDSNLSMIVLDNTDAAHKIGKAAKGRFLSNIPTLFQAYYLGKDEEQECFSYIDTHHNS